MYKYEDLIKSHLIDDGSLKQNEDELTCRCPFHPDKKPSFNINMETGLYHCFGCNESGNIVNFIAKRKGITTASAYQEIYGHDMTPVDQYSEDKHLPLDLLESLGVTNCYDKLKIPYYDENRELIATRFRHNPESETRFTWKKGDKATLYGLWKLKDFSNDYIVIVEGESDAQTLWGYNVPAVGVPRSD